MSNPYYFINKRTISSLAMCGYQFYVRIKFVSILLFPNTMKLDVEPLSIDPQEIKLQKLFILRYNAD